jgi:tetratricopeptide (TPR) repeat protein
MPNIKPITLAILLSLFSNIYCQNSNLESYKAFELSNKARYGKLTNIIRKLPINACLTKKVTVNIEIDEKGITLNSTIISGTSYSMLDSLVNYSIMSMEGNWVPFMKGDKTTKFNQNFGFTLVNIYSKKSIIKEERQFKRSASNGSGRPYKVVIHSKDYDLNKNCEDNDYYYLRGIEEYKNTKYTLAKSSFSNALDSNPYDLDSQYNLGMSYLKLKKIEKACKCFQKCAKYGDIGAIQQIKKLCPNK